MTVFFISFILFYVVGIPLSVLIHEIGHALGVILFSKEKVYVYLGTINLSNLKDAFPYWLEILWILLFGKGELILL